MLINIKTFIIKKKQKFIQAKESYYAKINKKEENNNNNINEDNIDIDELQFNKIMTNDINKLNEAKKIMDVI